jgi:hypothetical protein
MIAGTYIGSGIVLALLTVLFAGGSLGLWGFVALLLAMFFPASAGASSAYLTVSEIFPMETRALARAPSPQRRGRDLAAEQSAAAREQARRYRLGPGRTSYSPGMAVSAPITEVELSREIARIESTLAERGPTERRELARLVGARCWGPGRFSAAVREAVLSGRARRLGRTRFGPADQR